MSKQDANGVRTVQDLLRKFDFADILKLKKNVETQSKTLIKVNTDLKDFMTATNGNIENINNQIDGKTETWYSNGIPSLSNLPASTWTTDIDKAKHIQDMYYDKSTGYGYIFEYEDSNYKWSRIKDQDINQALAKANTAQDTADGKRTVFLEQPVPPYSSGDIWVNNDELYICQVGRIEGVYTQTDWVNSLKYTDNTVANAIITELGGEVTTILLGTVIEKTSQWVKITDLATGGSTVIDGSNITTGTINTDNIDIGNNNVKLDKDGIKLKNGAKVIGDNGLMNTYISESNNFVGYQGNDPLSITSVYKLSDIIDIIIPVGLVITSAKIELFHTPIYWKSNTDMNPTTYDWGYCRNLGLYKASNINSRKIQAAYYSEIVETEDTTYTEISSAFGASGYTATVPNDTTHATEKTTSTELKTAFEIAGVTKSGLYRFKIEPRVSLGSLNSRDICSHTGDVRAILKIDGYMTYS